jgi:arginine decarboxylase
MKPLYDAVLRYSKSEPLPFHMPGHKLGKGFLGAGDFLNIARFDLTELPETDNLHHPEGPIAMAQILAAEAFHAGQTRFLVNGSTTGIHAMIMAVCSPGSKLIIVRDFHMSAFNGMMLAGVRPCYVYPGNGSHVTAARIRAAAAANPDAAAIYITRPNYYGDVCELGEIVDIARPYGMAVLVDEAHGAHLVFSKKLPKSAMDEGADLCVQSAHKTLNAFTPGAYLHISGRAAANSGLTRRIDMALGCLETSSPSYIVMSSLDYAREYMQERGESELDRLILLCENFYANMEKLGYGVPINYIGETCDQRETSDPKDQSELSKPRRYCRDITRLVLNTRGIGITGVMAGQALRDMYNISVEMTDLDSIVMITTIADTAADFEVLKRALAELARKAAQSVVEQAAVQSVVGQADRSANSIATNWIAAQQYIQPEAWPASQKGVRSEVWSVAQQDEQSGADQPGHPSMPLLPDFRVHLHSGVTYTELSESAGMIAASMLTPYPPGIPLVCPGEVITPELCGNLEDMLQAGIKLIGIGGGNKIAVYSKYRAL